MNDLINEHAKNRVETFKGTGISRTSSMMNAKFEEFVRSLLPEDQNVEIQTKIATGDMEEESEAPKVKDASALKKFIESKNLVTFLFLNAHGGGKSEAQMMMSSDKIATQKANRVEEITKALADKPKQLKYTLKAYAEAKKLNEADGGWKFAIAPVKKAPKLSEAPDGVPEKYFFDNFIKTAKAKLAEIPMTVGYSSVMYLKDLLDAIKNSKSKRFFIIADSCFSGNIMTSPLWTDFAMKNTDKTVILITSSWIGVSSTAAGPAVGYTLTSMLGWDDERYQGWHEDFDPFIHSGVNADTPLSNLRETIRKGIYLLSMTGSGGELRAVKDIPRATLTYSEETGFTMKYAEGTGYIDKCQPGDVYGKTIDENIAGFEGTALKMNILKGGESSLNVNIVDRSESEINALKTAGSVEILFRCPFLVQHGIAHKKMQWTPWEELSEEERAGFDDPNTRKTSTASGTLIGSVHLGNLPGQTVGDFFRVAA